MNHSAGEKKLIRQQYIEVYFFPDKEDFQSSRQGWGWEAVQGGVVPSAQYSRVSDINVRSIQNQLRPAFRANKTI